MITANISEQEYEITLNSKILIVEDDNLIAKDLEQLLVDKFVNQ